MYGLWKFIKLVSYYFYTYSFDFVLCFSCLNGCVGWYLCSRLWTSNGLPLNTYISVYFFYDHRTVHRNRFLVNKTNRCTEFQLYWYYDSTCFGQPFCHSSGVLSRTSALVHFMQLWWRSSQLHKMYQSRCRSKNSWWWAERLPETCRFVIPIKFGIQCFCWFS